MKPPIRLMADPGVSAELRAGLRLAKQRPPVDYDTEAGLARFAALVGGLGGAGGAGAAGQAAAAAQEGAATGAAAQGGTPTSTGAATSTAAQGGAATAATGGASLAVKGGLSLKAALVGIAVACAVGAGVVAGLRGSPAADTTATASPEANEPQVAVQVASSDSPRPAEIVEEPSPVAALRAPAPEKTASVRTAAPAAATVTSRLETQDGTSSVKAEMDQLAEIRAVQGKSPARALELAEQGHARFAAGVFWQEREMIAIAALTRLGRVSEAQSRAQAFLARHPESPFAESLRAMTGVAP